jgi:hypothetical protein
MHTSSMAVLLPEISTTTYLKICISLPTCRINKLYINKGGMKFQGRNFCFQEPMGQDRGKRRVTTVDVNADGNWIFTCYSGSYRPKKATNQLFINQGNSSNGNPTFIDMAAEYGLASQGFSQSHIFD